MYSFTSLGVREESFYQNDGGVYTFRIRGALHHRIGACIPVNGQSPRFAQIHIHDPHDEEAQVTTRSDIFRNLN